MRMCRVCQKRTHALQQNGFYSITSSARSRNDSEILSPIALAALRFTTNSNLVGSHYREIGNLSMPSVAAHPRERFPKPCEHQDWFVQLKALADLKADLLQLRNRRRGAGVIEFIEFGVRLLRHNRRQGNILR